MEFQRAVTHEGALTLDDVLHPPHARGDRRHGRRAARGAAEGSPPCIAPVLGWDADRQAREVATYRAEVERDRACLAPQRAGA